MDGEFDGGDCWSDEDEILEDTQSSDAPSIKDLFNWFMV